MTYLTFVGAFFFKPQKYDLSYKHHIIQIVGDTKYINNVEE